MRNKFEKLTLLIIALAMVIGTTVCLSSCSNSMFRIVEELFENAADSEADGDHSDNGSENSGTSNKPEDNKGGVNESGGGNSDNTGSEDEDDGIAFYPGQGSVPAESISAKNRTLLSTVVVVSSFGTSPSAGSGVIYKLDKETGDAYIITNFHVIYNKSYGYCDSVMLYLYGMKYSTYAVSATVVGGSANYDIAVLKVEGSEVLKNSYAMAAELGDSDKVRVFDEVYAVGNPEGFGMAVTEGIVSVDSESLEMTGSMGSKIELRVMRVSAAINEGNSGGGLYSDAGKLIGIVCAKRIGSEIDNMAYAIPVNLAKNLVDNIIYFCSDGSTKTVQKPLIGITISSKASGIVADGETGEICIAEIIEISEIADTCIAKELVQVGDVINSITVDGVKIDVTRLYHVIDHMLTARVGSTVELCITRGGETLTVDFTVPQSAFSSVK